MMLRTLTATILLCSSIATATAGPEQAIVDTIVSRGYTKVVVCPRALSGDIGSGAGEEDFRGQAGPLAEDIAERVRQFLENNARGFTVVNARTAKTHLKGATLETLMDVSKFAEIREKTGADALVLLIVDDLKSEPRQLRFEVINLKTAAGDEPQPVDVEFTVSDLAFAGQSFELRRWVDGRLEPVGFDPPSELPMRVNGVGEESELMQVNWMKKVLPHPLSQNLPYGLAVEVDGESRPFIEFEGQYYVQIEEGEEFSVRVWNGLDRKTFMLLIVDGINSLTRRESDAEEFIHPLLAPTSVHWGLEAKYGTQQKVRIPGWSRFDHETGKLVWNRFKVVDRDSSVAAGQAVDDRFGLITAIFYTDGMKDIEAPAKDPEPRDSRLFGIGQGANDEATTARVAGNRGIIMSAISVHYRTGEEIQKMMAGSGNGNGNGGGGNGGDVKPPVVKDGDPKVAPKRPGTSGAPEFEPKGGTKKITDPN